MPNRPMANAPFYTASAAKCRRLVSELTEDVELAGGAALVAGIVPHAGWGFSGRVAAKVWKNLAARAHAATVIVFGAVHYPGIHQHTAYPEGAWDTPLGPLEVDAELARELEEALAPHLRLGSRAHDREHSIEVQLPFVKALWPAGSRFLPIATPPGRGARELGRRIAELTRGHAVVAVGSTDLTHYGERFLLTPAGTGPEARAWMERNDERMLARMLSLDADGVEPEAHANHNACGPGAVAATLGFAAARGAAEGTLLEHTTSFDVKPEPEFHMAVGYAGVVY